MTTITLTYGAVENLNAGHGYLPFVKDDGRNTMNTWASYGFSKEDAEAIALQSAHDKAARFCGDYDVRIVRE